jgi:hypothetical protein
MEPLNHSDRLDAFLVEPLNRLVNKAKLRDREDNPLALGQSLLNDGGS